MGEDASRRHRPNDLSTLALPRKTRLMVWVDYLLDWLLAEFQAQLDSHPGQCLALLCSRILRIKRPRPGLRFIVSFIVAKVFGIV
jgi:hypothetical protein